MRSQGCQRRASKTFFIQWCSLEDTIRSHEYRLRNRQAERLDGLEIDRRFELGGLLDHRSPGLVSLRILST
jgi:hypothetical protein